VAVLPKLLSTLDNEEGRGSPLGRDSLLLEVHWQEEANTSTRANQFGQEPVWTMMRREREWCARIRIWVLAWFFFLGGLVGDLWSLVCSVNDWGSL